MRTALTAMLVASILGCSDQAPQPSMVTLPSTVGPATDKLEVWAEIPRTRVPIQDSIDFKIHVKNPGPSAVVVTSACVSLMYVEALRDGEEVGLDGSGGCFTAITEHRFEAGEEKVIHERAWARSDGPLESGTYILRIATHAYDSVPEVEAPFSIR